MVAKMSAQAELLNEVPENSDSTNSQYHDPRSYNDDPLLDSLLILCSLHGKPASRATLSSGLPLENDRLTLNIFPRAAARAGLKARVVTRALDKIPPCPCPPFCYCAPGTGVLLGWNDDGSARFMPSESEGGEITVDATTLAQNYAGKVIFAHPRHEFDLQAEAFYRVLNLV